MDGCDKIKQFGVAISGCIDGFSRITIWLDVCTTSNNPCVIAGYFYEALSELAGSPAKLQGNLETENSHVKLLLDSCIWMEPVLQINILKHFGAI